jgi:Leu/Phe-tRNA-protein transferase
MHGTFQRAHIEDFIAKRLLIADYGSDIELLKRRLGELNEEFCHSFHFTRKILNRYCHEGFLPMSVEVYGLPLLSLKLHQQRVLLPPSGVRVKKNVLSKFAGHELSIDRDFERCMKAVRDYHRDSWISPPLAALYARSNRARGERAQLHSVELWNGAVLAAGEIGYTVGSCYTSLTGFHTVNSSGTAQLFALGLLLDRSGFKLWDMGMHAPYKLELGGKLYPREDFLDVFKTVRDDPVRLLAQSVFLADLRADSTSDKKNSL